MKTLVDITSIFTSLISVITGLRFYFRFGRQEKSHWGWLFLVMATVGLSLSEFVGTFIDFQKGANSNLDDIFVIFAEILLAIGFVRLFNRELVEEKVQQKELEQSLANSEKLLAASIQLGDSLNLNKTISNFIRRALVLANADIATIYLSEKIKNLDGQYFSARRGGRISIYEQPMGEITEKILETGQPLVVPNSQRESRHARANLTTVSETMAGFPLKEGEHILGILFVGYEKHHRFDQRDMLLMTSLAELGTLAIRNAILYQQVEELSLTDGLTGLANRRYFDKTLALELARARRYNDSLGLLILDLDHFKLINDTWGHPAGDAILKMVAGVLQENVRLSDLPARVGGEELALLLLHAGQADAFQFAERLRYEIEKTTIEWHGQVIHTTCSIGAVAQTGISLPSEPQEFYQLADRALYLAKEAGRNRISGI